jgi:hypothetical protein
LSPDFASDRLLQKEIFENPKIREHPVEMVQYTSGLESKAQSDFFANIAGHCLQIV